MDELRARRADEEEIVIAIREKRILYAPAWWHRYGEYLRTVEVDGKKLHIYKIERFEIGEEPIEGGIRYLDDRILRVELEARNKEI